MRRLSPGEHAALLGVKEYLGALGFIVECLAIAAVLGGHRRDVHLLREDDRELGAMTKRCRSRANRIHARDLAARMDRDVLGARFWTLVERDQPGKCWEWRGHLNDFGYGVFNGLDAPLKAHRLAFWLTTGEWPDAVLHTCDNPPCVNPRHLWAGTQRDNLRDMREKGRGSPPPVSKRQPQCGRGHDLTQPSSRYKGRGCVICSKARAAAHYRASKGVVLAGIWDWARGLDG